MINQAQPKHSRRILIATITIIALIWMFLLAFAHRLLHEHGDLISTLLTHPAQQIAAAAFSLSVLIYLIIWSLPNVKRPTWRGFVTISLWALLIVLGQGVTHTGEGNAQELVHDLREMMGITGFLVLACAYALLLAMPFVAGVEIGLLIMVVFGVPGVIVAYCGTIIGLNLAFLIGRLLPISVIQKILKKLNIEADDASFDSFLDSLASQPGWISKLVKSLLDHRYLTLAIGLNFPGNSLVGGGGGLSLIAGLSRNHIYWPYFALITALATLPVPLLVMFGILSVEQNVEHSGWFHNLLVSAYSILPSF